MKPTRTQELNAVFFTALSHRRRQMLCEILLRHAPNGLSFGMLQRQSGLKISTLTHHLRFMYQGGILKRKQKGREAWISVDAERLFQLSNAFGADVARNTRKAGLMNDPAANPAMVANRI